MRTRLPWSILIVASLVATAQPVSARILTTKPTPSETWNPILPLTIGGGFEFQTDRQQSEYDFPMLLEYNFSEQLKATVEPNFVYIESKSTNVTSVGGVGDLETSMEWEFLRERRFRPALTLEGIIKWPTAAHPDLGSPGRDYSLGLIASKDLVFVDVDLGVRYTSIGDPQGHDNFEVTVAGELPLNHFWSLEGESVTAIETGHGGRTDTEGTVGVLWHATKHLKLEVGGTLKSDGTWQVISAWEWSFAGED